MDCVAPLAMTKGNKPSSTNPHPEEPPLRRLEGRGPDVKRIHPATTGQRLNLSPRSLQRRLAEENTSLSAIVRAVRIREACHLLSESGLSLTEIGYWCGFSDSPHFSREFRRALAMPPSVCRLSAAS
jgi:AraC-like DNA-binding protein